MIRFSPSRIAILLMLAFAGAVGVTCLTSAIALARSNAAEAIFLAGLGLLSTLAYPGLIDLEHRVFGKRTQAARLPMYVYDAFFLGGVLIATSRLTSQVSLAESVGIAFLLGAIAGGAARRRAAELDGTASK